MKPILALLSVGFVLIGCMGSDSPSLANSTATPVTRAPALYAWMNPEIADAWDRGYLGQNTQISVVDEFDSGPRFRGNLGTGTLFQRHGDWVALQTGMIAPSTTIVERDWSSNSPVKLASKQLNVMNLSYGVFFDSEVDVSSITWSLQEKSLIDYAFDGRAVVVKSAGNSSIPLDGVSGGTIDGLNAALIGAEAAIFVGALDRNGTLENQASLAHYSNFAGSNETIQRQFLSVGVPSDLMGGLAGTSFAAPVVSGYAAVIGSKFVDATPTQIANQLLNTARTDTIAGYSAAVHGRGEASISRALAPSSIK